MSSFSGAGLVVPRATRPPGLSEDEAWLWPFMSEGEDRVFMLRFLIATCVILGVNGWDILETLPFDVGLLFYEPGWGWRSSKSIVRVAYLLARPMALWYTLMQLAIIVVPSVSFESKDTRYWDVLHVTSLTVAIACSNLLFLARVVAIWKENIWVSAFACFMWLLNVVWVIIASDFTLTVINAPWNTVHGRAIKAMFAATWMAFDLTVVVLCVLKVVDGNLWNFLCRRTAMSQISTLSYLIVSNGITYYVLVTMAEVAQVLYRYKFEDPSSSVGARWATTSLQVCVTFSAVFGARMYRNVFFVVGSHVVAVDDLDLSALFEGDTMIDTPVPPSPSVPRIERPRRPSDAHRPSSLRIPRTIPHAGISSPGDSPFETPVPVSGTSAADGPYGRFPRSVLLSPLSHPSFRRARQDEGVRPRWSRGRSGDGDWDQEQGDVRVPSPPWAKDGPSAPPMWPTWTEEDAVGRQGHVDPGIPLTAVPFRNTARSEWTALALSAGGAKRRSRSR